MSQRILMVAAVSLAVSALAASAALAAGGGQVSIPEETAEHPRSPEEEAAEHYNRGLSQRNRAWKLEKKLEAESDPAKRAKLERKIDGTWKRAIAEFATAVSKNPGMYQAFSSLGYALRKTGDFPQSIAAYDRALSIEPNYAEAIEYRAEAYLGLNRVEEAKQAYIELFGSDREMADELMAAMKKWLADRRAHGGGVAESALTALEEWIEEREEIASQTASASIGRQRTGDW